MGVFEGTGAATATANELARPTCRGARPGGAPPGGWRSLNAEALLLPGTATMRCTFT
ncbi:hypothetical protein GCM10023088_42770 [Actinomadura verrucosospora]